MALYIKENGVPVLVASDSGGGGGTSGADPTVDITRSSTGFWSYDYSGDQISSFGVFRSGSVSSGKAQPTLGCDNIWVEADHSTFGGESTLTFTIYTKPLGDGQDESEFGDFFSGIPPHRSKVVAESVSMSSAATQIYWFGGSEPEHSSAFPNNALVLSTALSAGPQADAEEITQIDVTYDVGTSNSAVMTLKTFGISDPLVSENIIRVLEQDASGGGDPGGGGGGSDENALAFAKGAGLAVEQGLLAAAGQPALTVLAVGATTGKVQGCSLGDGNVVEVYASGTDFNDANVLYREFMGAGEPICFTGLSPGAIITSSQGFYGMGEQVQGSHESPMPLLSLGLAFTSSFVYCFRNSNNYPGEGVSTGQITIVNGALPSTVSFTNNGNQVRDQEPKDLAPFELCYFYSDRNGEFTISSTNKVMACVQAYMGTNPALQPGDPGDSAQRFYDARLVMPLTNDGMTWPRSGFVSAPYENTASKYYVRDGVTGDFPLVSPNAPVDFDASGSTGANDSDYEPRGCTRLRATGLVSAYSGADSAGLEASPMIPVSAMSQVVAQPFCISDNGDGGNSSVAIGSPYEGTAKVYQWNSATGVAELAYTVPIGRGTAGQGIVPTAPEDQYIPCAGLIANEPTLDADPSVVQLEGQLNPGYVVADVPVTVVAQNGTPTLTPDIRSQNGETTTSIVTDDDETLMLGWTPAQLKAEVTEDAAGFTRRRELDADGVATFTLT